MTASNRLKAYVRRTILAAAKEYAYPKARRTSESTRSALIDAMRGTDTGWWADLIYTAPMLEMAHKYRKDIAAALGEYRDATGEAYRYWPQRDQDIVEEGHIALALLNGPYHLDGENPEGREWSLIGLRFAVEWYAAEVARDLGVEV